MGEKWRCKLEYYLENFDVKDRRRIAHTIYRDAWGEGGELFQKKYYPWLENPDSNDSEVLSCVDLDLAQKFFGDAAKERDRESLKRKYRNAYASVNYYCRKNHAKEMFTNPQDIPNSERERRDLVAMRRESDLNEFFGVANYYDYKRPYVEYDEEE